MSSHYKVVFVFFICWQDVLIPFAMDPRLEDDCLFIVFEEDFRFAPEFDDPAWKHGGRRDTSRSLNEALYGSSRPPTTQGASSSGAASSTEPTAGQQKAKMAQHPGSWVRKNVAETKNIVLQERATREDWKVTSMYLRDLVAFANDAHRKKRGEFMFMGWQPFGAGGSGKIDRYGSGAMCTMMSKSGARRLQYGFEHDDTMSRPGHMDLVLKRFWSQPEHSQVCYITPPLGGYFEHISGCERAFKDTPRPSVWLEAWCCPGTRARFDWNVPPRAKWWCTFTSKGHCDYVCRVDVDQPDAQFEWKTLDLRRSLGAAAEPTAGWKWGSYTWDDEANKWTLETDRQKRAGRRVRMNEKFRNWVHTEAEARLRHTGPCDETCNRMLLSHTCLNRPL